MYKGGFNPYLSNKNLSNKYKKNSKPKIKRTHKKTKAKGKNFLRKRKNKTKRASKK